MPTLVQWIVLRTLHNCRYCCDGAQINTQMQTEMIGCRYARGAYHAQLRKCCCGRCSIDIATLHRTVHHSSQNSVCISTLNWYCTPLLDAPHLLALLFLASLQPT